MQRIARVSSGLRGPEADAALRPIFKRRGLDRGGRPLMKSAASGAVLVNDHGGRAFLGEPCDRAHHSESILNCLIPYATCSK